MKEITAGKNLRVCALEERRMRVFAGVRAGGLGMALGLAMASWAGEGSSRSGTPANVRHSGGRLASQYRNGIQVWLDPGAQTSPAAGTSPAGRGSAFPR